MKVDKKDVPKHFKVVGVDSDLIVYRAAFAAQHTYWDVYKDGEFFDRFQSAKDANDYIEQYIEFTGGDASEFSKQSEIVLFDEQRARDACDTIISNIHKRVPADKYLYYLTDSDGNYREKIATTLSYKGNRPPKPHFYQTAKDHILHKWQARIAIGAEADDACSIVGYKGYTSPYETCIVTADKDLLGCPGWLYNFTKDEWHYTTELEADRFFFMQCLMGDKQVDNILGLADVSQEFREKYALPKRKGVGKASAKKLLKDCQTSQEMFAIVREAYESYHGDNWETVLNEMGALLWMQRQKGKIFCCDWYKE